MLSGKPFISEKYYRTAIFINKRFAHAPNHSGNDFRHARKCQTTRETTFAMRGNAKPLGKRLSPGAEMPNHSGNDFRPARKCQTTREMTFAMRGNAKLLGKRLSPCAEMPNHSENDFRPARKCRICLVCLLPCPATKYGLTWSEKRAVPVLPRTRSSHNHSRKTYSYAHGLPVRRGYSHRLLSPHRGK